MLLSCNEAEEEKDRLGREKEFNDLEALYVYARNGTEWLEINV